MGESRRSERRGRGAPGPEADRPLQEPTGPAAALLALQRRAGNTAVSRLVEAETAQRLRRKPVDPPPGKHVTEMEFTVGDEIDLKLATQAVSLAAGGVTAAELLTLRTRTLGDATITDDERMFLAGLLDAANASQVAAAKPKTGTTFRFSRASIQSRLSEVANLERPAVDPSVTSALGAGDLDAADTAALKQIAKLAPAQWAKKANAAVAFGSAASVRPAAILKAMIAAASDSTTGDQVMAGTVYVIAAAASHATAGDVQSGRIKVDEKPGKAVSKAEFAVYHALGTGKFKGDTIYVPGELDVANLGHRAHVIHELTHALDDKSAPAGKLKMVTRDRAELRAYRAQARYMLDQIAPLGAKDRGPAVGKAAATTNLIITLALVLESMGDAKRQAIVAEIDGARAGQKLGKKELAALGRRGPDRIEEAVVKAIRQEYAIENAGGAEIPGANEAPLDALSGESVLAWIDKEES